jgi:diguanylate cyclase (GGDEF)-like protein
MEPTGVPGLLTDSLSVDPAAAAAAAPKHPKAGAQLYLNRELGQLAFTRRVLAQAMNPAYPLLERLKFLCIVSSNLDEFFMVRVAGLKGQVRGGIADKSPDGLTPSEQLVRIGEAVSSLASDQQARWRELRDELKTANILLVDADSFKPLNDALGHLHGDECLRELARICAGFVEDAHDLVARFGGEELVLLLPGRDQQAAHAIGERLRQRVEALALPHPSSSVAPHVTVSVGVGAILPDATLAPETLIDVADRALYVAKARGRNCVVSRLDTPADGV